ncbi:MAG: YgiT-type zinc finger protein [Desulfitobacterium hafniense]|nr:YgiT-type zinc finger protein [Desulfitobacterium hafniense]
MGICSICGGEKNKVYRTVSHTFHGITIKLKNQEVYVCGKCGEIYYPAGLLDSIEQMIISRQREKGLSIDEKNKTTVLF